MSSNATLSTTGEMLHALKRWLLTLTSCMGDSSPTQVLHNLVRILEGASPRLQRAIALLTPWAMLAAALAGYGKLWLALHTTCKYLIGSMYASVRIPGTHSLQTQVLAYVVEQGLGVGARSLTLSPPQRVAKQLDRRYFSPYDTIYGHGARSPPNQRHAEPEENEKPPLAYVPQVGSYAFWWRGNRITLRQEARAYDESDGKVLSHIVNPSPPDIELSCISLFGGAGPIRDFLKFVQSIPTKESTTTIYRPKGPAWDAGVVQSSRTLNAVTMNKIVKDSLVCDIETYLTPATKKYYANRGIPYRRGFLFYGPPGTGKTSFANAMAGHFKLNIYMISLSNKQIDDAMLESLFEQLPNKCIVLLEDIDSAGIKRENMRQKQRKPRTVKTQTTDEYGEPIYVASRGVTLSGLLNVIDGIHSREGMITIMTSNTPDSLDPALVRPGRIDRKVLFSYASKEVNARLFRHIFEKTEEERVAGDAVGSEHDITALSEQFAETVPADKLTPADVQGFLLVHRADPVTAIAEAKAWAENTLEVKAKGANVATFEGATKVEPACNADGQHGAERNDSVHEDDSASEGTESSQDPGTIANGLAHEAGMRFSPMPTHPTSRPLYPRSGHPTAPWSEAWQRVDNTLNALGGLPSVGRRTLHEARPSAPQGLTELSSLGSGIVGQPTPPYSRSVSRSPPKIDETSAKEGGGEADQGDSRKSEKGGEGEKRSKDSD